MLRPCIIALVLGLAALVPARADAALSISGDAAVAEGSSSVIWPLSLTVSDDAAPTYRRCVQVVTVPGTAVVSTSGDGDYVPVTTELCLEPGVTSRDLTVWIGGDSTFEPDETFSVQLSNAIAYSTPAAPYPIGDDRAEVTLLNDDSPPSSEQPLLPSPVDNSEFDLTKPSSRRRVFRVGSKGRFVVKGARAKCPAVLATCRVAVSLLSRSGNPVAGGTLAYEVPGGTNRTVHGRLSGRQLTRLKRRGRLTAVGLSVVIRPPAGYSGGLHTSFYGVTLRRSR